MTSHRWCQGEEMLIPRVCDNVDVHKKDLVALKPTKLI